MIIGYAKSIFDRSKFRKTIGYLKKLGVEKIFTEKQSGKSVENRPVFQEALQFCQNGRPIRCGIY